MTEETQEVEEATEITMEEVSPELLDMVGENKAAKKLTRLGEKILKKLNGSLEAERTILRKKISEGQERLNGTIREWTTTTNSNLDKFQKKYEGMYNYLIRQFLVGLENRVFTNEMFAQASLDLLLKRLYELKKETVKAENLPSWEDFVKQAAEEHGQIMQEQANKYAEQQKRQEEAAKEAQGVVEKKEEGTEDQDSGLEQDGVGQKSDSENSGTDSPGDSGDSESEAGREESESGS